MGKQSMRKHATRMEQGLDGVRAEGKPHTFWVVSGFARRCPCMVPYFGLSLKGNMFEHYKNPRRGLGQNVVFTRVSFESLQHGHGCMNLVAERCRKIREDEMSCLGRTKTCT